MPHLKKLQKKVGLGNWLTLGTMFQSSKQLSFYEVMRCISIFLVKVNFLCEKRPVAGRSTPQLLFIKGRTLACMQACVDLLLRRLGKNTHKKIQMQAFEGIHTQNKIF